MAGAASTALLFVDGSFGAGYVQSFACHAVFRSALGFFPSRPCGRCPRVFGRRALAAAPTKKSSKGGVFSLSPYVSHVLSRIYAHRQRCLMPLFCWPFGVFAIGLETGRRKPEAFVRHRCGAGPRAAHKGFFLPITAAMAAFLLLRLWHDASPPLAQARKRVGLVGMFFPALLIGGTWYLSRLALSGDFSGGIDSVRLAQAGGWIAGLNEHFSLFALGRSVASTLFSFLWNGTWSLVSFPLPFYIPLLVLAFWAFGAFVFQIETAPRIRLCVAAGLAFCLFRRGPSLPYRYGDCDRAEQVKRPVGICIS